MVLRLGTPQDAVSRWRRRTILRFGFLGAVGLAATETLALVTPFIRVNRVEGLGSPVAIGTKASLLQLFSTTNDRPILFREGRFFLLHAPGGSSLRIAIARTSAAPFRGATRRSVHCPCHGSEYDKRTAVVLRIPAPKRCSSFTSPRAPTSSCRRHESVPGHR